MIFTQNNKPKVTVLNTGIHVPAPELEVGKIYDAFDDGKISWSRLAKWEILECIDLDNENDLKKITNDPDQNGMTTLAYIAREIEYCDWLYTSEQKFIYRAKMIDSDTDCYCYFLRTQQGGWFGALSWFDSELDYDGKLIKMLRGE